MPRLRHLKFCDSLWLNSILRKDTALDHLLHHVCTEGYLFTLLFYLLRFSVCFFLCPALKVQLNVDPVLVRFFAFLLPLTNKYIYRIHGSAMINGKVNEVNCQGRELSSYLQSMKLQSSFHSIIPFIWSIILCFCDIQLLII